MDTGDKPLDRPILTVAGAKVALGPLRRDLVPLYHRWISDLEVARGLMASGRPLTLEAEEAWYDRASADERSAVFTIYELATLRPVGNTGLHDLDRTNRTGVFGIAIGERECWGKGYGTEATRLVLDYGFNVVGLHSVMLTAYSFNERAIRAYLRAGFREFGRRREALWRGGRAYDMVYMDCLAPEFQGSALGRLWPEATKRPG